MTSPILSSDIGGTKVLTALISPRGRVLARDYSLTPSRASPAAVVELIAEAGQRLMARAGVTPVAAAVAAAGLVDVGNGVVTTSPNLPGWRDAPLRALLEQELGLRASLLNDATAAALGEQRLGAGRGARDLVFITVSTGIGGGVVIGGRLYQGASGAAGEIGHMVIQDGGPRCACGNDGCLEALASGTAIARYAAERIAAGETTSLSAFATPTGAGITAEVVARAAGEGDPLAREVMARAAYYLGVGLANLVNIFNPEVIVVGGGVAQAGDMLFEPARRVMRERAFKLPASAVRVVPARLGADAGIVGAALYAVGAGSGLRRAA